MFYGNRALAPHKAHTLCGVPYQFMLTGGMNPLLRCPKQPSGLRLYPTKQPFWGDPGRFDSVADNAATWLPSTAATRSGRCIHPRRRSHRSPSALRGTRRASLMLGQPTADFLPDCRTHGTVCASVTCIIREIHRFPLSLQNGTIPLAPSGRKLSP